MFNWDFSNLGAGVFLLVLWETFWKIIALWRSAKKGDKLWFIAIFVINFFGLVPIFYLWRTKQLESVFKDIKEFFRLKFHK
ncbi:hypothetical protein KKE03_03190 [Patescibacteria group bacterium]|nr:hypothetical protein [Patescibacteria group bacterium]